MIDWLRQMFSPHLLITSQPYENGRSWVYFFGDEQGFELRRFETQDEAAISRNLLVSAIKMAPWISTRHSIIDVATAQRVADLEGYREVLRSLSRSG